MKHLSIVMYHYVRPIKNSKYPNIKGLELELFKQQLDFFKTHFSVVTMEEVIDSLSGKCTLPDNAVLLTFDDGYMDHYQHVFPLLKQYNMQGSFFVPSGILKYEQVLDVNKIHFILACMQLEELLLKVYAMLQEYRDKGYELESDDVLFSKLAVANRWDSKEVIFVKRLLQSYLDESLRGEMVNRLFEEAVGVPEREFSHELYVNLEQIKEMKNAGMYFGLHGERHYWLNHLPVDKMKEDINNSLEYFQNVMDMDYLAMNYPYGGYNEDVLAYCKSIGCKLGFSVEARHVDFDRDNPLAVPRLDTNDFPPKSENYKNMYIRLDK